MGITTLLQQLKPVTQSVHLSELPPGSVVAIDTYCWLHRATFYKAEKILMQGSTEYLANCIQYIESVLYFGLVPILIFDGKNVGAKKETDLNRQHIREFNRQLAIAHLRQKMSIPYKYIGGAVEINHDIAYPLIQICQARGIHYIVAPYEADAQLAFLFQQKIIDYVISEDSDLLVHKCDRVIFKYDPARAVGDLIEYSNIKKVFDYDGAFNDDKFRLTCIISGCDYAKSIKGVGLKTAYKIVKENRNNWDIKYLANKLRYIGELDDEQAQEYFENFNMANRTFLSQVVFNPFTSLQQNLNPVPANEPYPEYCGIIEEDPNYCASLAAGNIDPETGERQKNASHYKLQDFTKFLNRFDPKPDPSVSSQGSSSSKELFEYDEICFDAANPNCISITPDKSKIENEYKAETTILNAPKNILRESNSSFHSSNSISDSSELEIKTSPKKILSPFFTHTRDENFVNKAKTCTFASKFKTKTLPPKPAVMRPFKPPAFLENFRRNK